MRNSILTIVLSAFVLIGCSNAEQPAGGKSMTSQGKNLQIATFAGGCFWCMEPPFEKLDGVVEVISGYTGGEKVNPTYEEVSSGATGHYEAIQIIYDPEKVSYEQLLDVFWRNTGTKRERGYM